MSDETRAKQPMTDEERDNQQRAMTPEELAQAYDLEQAILLIQDALDALTRSQQLRAMQEILRYNGFTPADLVSETRSQKS
jgi:hypothetical protein